MDTSGLRVIITGVTGMVGEGVLHECLHHPQVESVLVINRKPCDVKHPKLKEIIHHDFFNVTPLSAELARYNACFFCLGISSIGIKEEEYFRVTHTLTLHIARVLCNINPDMTFCYVSGASTDSSEQGRSMWARVKGKTENDLFKLPFKQVYAFRPGYIHPTPGLKNTHTLYKYIQWLYKPLRALFPNALATLCQVGYAMINAALYGYPKKILEVKDITILAQSPR
jgi:hypothetical protein